MTTQAKTFRAPTMPEALAKVQIELGPEAVVLGVRKVLDGPAWQVWRDPEFEVMALPGDESASTGAMVWEPSTATSGSVMPEPVTHFSARLIEQGLDESFVNKIIASAVDGMSLRGLSERRMVRDFLSRALASRLTVGEFLPRKGEQRVVALVGISGVGKTSAAAKLAAYARYNLGRSVALISVDTFRVGALTQIQTFAEILDVPLSVCYTPGELSAALAAHADKDLIVVDTPGRNTRRALEMVEITTLFTPLPQSRRTYFVASATSKTADLAEATTAFKGLGLNGLIFTKLDETGGVGSLYMLAQGVGLAVSYFCSGPRVPEDIEPASAERMAELLLGW